MIVLALAFLHGRHVVHGDVKPANIMYDMPTHEVMLIDIGGSCVALEHTGFANSCMRNGAPGTKAYMSADYEEHFNQGTTREMSEADKQKNDMFALGVTLSSFLSKKCGTRTLTAKSQATTRLRAEKPLLVALYCSMKDPTNIRITSKKARAALTKDGGNVTALLARPLEYWP